MFTEQELAAMALADREIEAGFHLEKEDMAVSKELDRVAKLESVLPEERKLAEYKKAYYEANREKIAEYQKAYYEANRENLAEYKKAYREANREKIAEYQKAYYEANRKKKRESQ